MKDAAKPLPPLSVWLLAIRPKTLPAAVAPVVVGTALAVAGGAFHPTSALAALAGSLLLQIGVNLSNDFFDFIKGVDTPERLGPVRVTQSGLLAPKRVMIGMICTFACAVLVGLYLIARGGWPIVVIGFASILAALCYSGGPYPLASHGLGDLFVFLFFGLVAVCGTYYVQTLYLTGLAVLASVPVGFLITAILVVNNLRDIPTDSRTGKNTLAVIWGPRGARVEFFLLICASYLMPVLLWVAGWASPGVLLTFLSLPVAFRVGRTVLKNTGPMLNEALAGTGRLSLLFSLLFGLGLIFPVLAGFLSHP
jgi:1,4-dihydroxy-2-naphthoate polyprenyltransferase